MDKTEEPLSDTMKLVTEHPKGLPMVQKVVEKPQKVKDTSRSKFNALKSGKYSKAFMAQCDQCYLRPEENGGSGGCPYFKAEASCILDKEIREKVDEYDLTDLDDLLEVVGDLGKDMLVRGKKALMQAMMEGNYLDKNSIQTTEKFLTLAKTIFDFKTKTRVAATQTVTEGNAKTGKFKTIMQSLSVDMQKKAEE